MLLTLLADLLLVAVEVLLVGPVLVDVRAARNGLVADRPRLTVLFEAGGCGVVLQWVVLARRPVFSGYARMLNRSLHVLM